MRHRIRTHVPVLAFIYLSNKISGARFTKILWDDNKTWDNRRIVFLFYAALLARRGPHIASHSVCPSVCPSVPLSLPSVTSRHLANYNDTHVLFGTRWGPHIVRPSRPHKFLFITHHQNWHVLLLEHSGLFVAYWYSTELAACIIRLYSPPGRHIILVFWRVNILLQNSDCITVGIKYTVSQKSRPVLFSW